MQLMCCFSCISGELTRGLVTLPPKVDPGAVSGQKTGMEDPQGDPLAVHCFCVFSGSALLGDLLGVSRSRERDLLSVLLIFPRIFLNVFIAYRRYRLLVGFLFVRLYSAIMFMCVSCFGLVVSTCQVIGYRKTHLMTPS